MAAAAGGCVLLRTEAAERARIPEAIRQAVIDDVALARAVKGRSTVATSLAWLLGDKAHRSTALLDLDIHFGTGALALDLEPGRGLADAIENPASAIARL